MPPRYWIIVDISQFMLHLLEGDRVVKSYPIGIGTIASASPEGTFTIINKQPNPGGPFGVLWMGLSKPHYGIHGTNRPDSIGKRSSHGCIRMYNDDVLDLSAKVPVGTEVRIRK
ncbi:putative L,D-transpeptidase YkuD [compost metagenome]